MSLSYAEFSGAVVDHLLEEVDAFNLDQKHVKSLHLQITKDIQILVCTLVAAGYSARIREAGENPDDDADDIEDQERALYCLRHDRALRSAIAANLGLLPPADRSPIEDALQRVAPSAPHHRFRIFDWESTATFHALQDHFDGPVEHLVFAIQEGFTHLRGYHACSPAELGTYLNSGLRTLDPKRHGSLAAEIFRSAPDRVLSLAQIQEATEAVDTDLDAGRTFVSLDSRGYPLEAGHYLLYGSEHVMCIAAELESRTGHPFRQYLRSGTPTVFSFDIPTEELDDWQIQEIAQTVYERRRELGLPGIRRPPQVDHTVVFRKDLPADWINGWDHPKLIRDPHERGMPFRWVYSRMP